MRKLGIGFGFILFSLLLFNCSSDSEETPVTPEAPEETSENPIGEVSVILTTSDGSVTLNELSTKLPFTTAPTGDITITVDEDVKLQTIEGFGGALTGSSAFLLKDNTEALNALFSSDGIGLSYTRLTVGASDFNNNGSYSYNDISEVEDLELLQFSISEDFEDDNPIIPVAKNILSINSNMSFLASPWTAPPWMKNNRSYNGGSLLPQYFEVYSDYLIKYLQGYADEGISINAITVQNEPLFETSNYPTMKMTANEQASFIGEFFGPTLAASSLSTRIIGYDHNFREDEDPNFPVSLLSDAAAASYTNAIAYHAYAGVPSNIDALTASFPDVDIYFTEQSGIQNAGTTFGGELDFFMKNVFMGTLRRGAKTVLLWNLALDENLGPQNGGCEVCRGIITISGNGTITRNVEYYMLGHFTKYVEAGAQVVSTNALQGIMENVAFENPDGSKVLVVYNSSSQSTAQNLNVTIGNDSFQYMVSQGALITFKWD